MSERDRAKHGGRESFYACGVALMRATCMHKIPSFKHQTFLGLSGSQTTGKRRLRLPYLVDYPFRQFPYNKPSYLDGRIVSYMANSQ